jgi:hypothetical protein
MYKPLQILTVKAPTMIRASLTTTAVNLKKITKDNPMKKYNRENKLLFGALLETQAQRKKRLKEEGILMREAKENEPDDPPVSNIEVVEISKPLEIECDYSKMTLSEILSKFREKLDLFSIIFCITIFQFFI